MPKRTLFSSWARVCSSLVVLLTGHEKHLPKGFPISFKSVTTARRLRSEEARNRPQLETALERCPIGPACDRDQTLFVKTKACNRRTEAWTHSDLLHAKDRIRHPNPPPKQPRSPLGRPRGPRRIMRRPGSSVSVGPVMRPSGLEP